MRRAVRLLSVAFLLSGCPPRAPIAATPMALTPVAGTLRAPTEQSELIFQGTVLKVGESNLPQLPASPSTATVRIDQVIDGPERLGDLSGKEVTVELREPSSVKEGTPLVFFTQVGMLGRTLGLREIEHRPAEPNAAELRRAVGEIRARIGDDRLAARIKAAEVVLAGRVVDVKPLERRESIQSEHDPDWRVATLQVELPIKGQPRQTVQFVYPGSMDVAWFQVPKPQVGRDGIFILRRQQLPHLPEEVLTALDPDDVLDRSQLERVRRLASEVSR